MDFGQTKITQTKILIKTNQRIFNVFMKMELEFWGILYFVLSYKVTCCFELLTSKFIYILNSSKIYPSFCILHFVICFFANLIIIRVQQWIKKSLYANSRKHVPIGWRKRTAVSTMFLVNSMKLAKINQLAFFIIWPNQVLINPNQKLCADSTAFAVSQAVHLNMTKSLKIHVKVSVPLN